MTQDVDPQTYYDVGKGLYEKAGTVYNAFKTSVATLGETGSMAGSTDDGKAWAQSYDSRAADVLGAVNDLTKALENYGGVIIQAGYNHAMAEYNANPSRKGAPPVRPADPASVAGELTAPPSAGGPGTGLIENIGVLEHIGIPVPDGDTDKLGKASTAWNQLATGPGTTGVVQALGGNAAKFRDTKSPEVDYIVKDLDELHQAADAVLGSCAELAQSCSEYKTSLDELRTKMKETVEDLVEELAISAAIGIATAFLSAGVGAFAATAKAAASIKKYAGIIRGFIETWKISKNIKSGVKKAHDVAGIRKRLERIKNLGRKGKGEEPKPEPKPTPKRGKIDESAKPFSPEERKVADLLADEGKEVKALKEADSPGQRTPDALVDGKPTEFKSLSEGATNTTVKNALNSAKGQADNAVIDGRASGISKEEAQRGLDRFLGANPDRMTNIRIVGDGWEILWP
ncbi:CdiA C-terminal domain-containing protein [Mycolicibacterium llatzerense]|uniref:CdiA C-terminal domain-containing protein n=1 Tax=Mycolicibacterium llatzerense TaxID=280871 RepID=UPI0021B601A8|nr:hypothetical protein [Mycolicibacterium llatzerense]MCT7361372.1 hypothetical protein [Mycolicibacterium llatzerense]